MATTRRELLIAGVGATTLLACRHGAVKAGDKEAHEEEEITPAEDLMREHGVLRRILLVYGECARRLQANEAVLADALASAAAIVKKFIHDYHEQLEEQHLFPRFEAAKQHVELVTVLRAQHKAGAVLTERIRAGGADTKVVIAAIRDFTRMYEPHAAREDTVLFPALIKVIGREQYKELGEQFEDQEHKLFARGFEGIVDEVAAIETSLGIADLAKFTPQV
jgi:hemerythrin-like domain-containing protein